MKKIVVFSIILVVLILSLWGCMLFPPGPHIEIEVAPKVYTGSKPLSIKLHETAGVECKIRNVLLDKYSLTGSAISHKSYAATEVFSGATILPAKGYLVGSLTTMISTETGYMVLTINATDAYNQIFDVCATVTVSASS